MAAAMIMNSNSLPVALLQSLVVTVPGLQWDEDDTLDTMVARALSYLLLCGTMGQFVSLSLCLLYRRSSYNDHSFAGVMGSVYFLRPFPRMSPLYRCSARLAQSAGALEIGKACYMMASLESSTLLRTIVRLQLRPYILEPDFSQALHHAEKILSKEALRLSGPMPCHPPTVMS